MLIYFLNGGFCSFSCFDSFQLTEGDPWRNEPPLEQSGIELNGSQELPESEAVDREP